MGRGVDSCVWEVHSPTRLRVSGGPEWWEGRCSDFWALVLAVLLAEFFKKRTDFDLSG